MNANSLTLNNWPVVIAVLFLAFLALALVFCGDRR
jgi:hypothetical protein